MGSATSKSVEVHYFALLRERRGLSHETIHTAAPTPRTLYAELQGRHGFDLPAGTLQVAINDRYHTWDAPLCDGDRVVFIQPVAGG